MRYNATVVIFMFFIVSKNVFIGLTDPPNTLLFDSEP